MIVLLVATMSVSRSATLALSNPPITWRINMLGRYVLMARPTR